MSFHAPERARITSHPVFGSSSADGNNGAFDLDSPEPGWRLALIVSDGTDADVPEGLGWEHVSIHAYRGHDGPTLRMRTPTWREMSYVKDLFWDGEDIVMQLHPKKSEYVNNHPNVLHLWRPTHRDIPTPPSLLVGVLAVQP